jgi:hypothetical protein
MRPKEPSIASEGQDEPDSPDRQKAPPPYDPDIDLILNRDVRRPAIKTDRPEHVATRRSFRHNT